MTTETDGRALVVQEEQVQSLLVGTPADRVTQATQIANALSPVITGKHLYADIQGKKHVLYEGWATLGALVGVFPVTVWTKETENGYLARVEARTIAGAVVGAAEAECSRTENRWASAPDYAVRSMAQTRAGSKALRMPLGFIMQLAGFEGTPAEEMDGVIKEPPAGAPEVADCPHGPRVFQSGTKNGKPWQGFFCSKRVKDCNPVWIQTKTELRDVANEVRREREPDDIEYE